MGNGQERLGFGFLLVKEREFGRLASGYLVFLFLFFPSMRTSEIMSFGIEISFLFHFFSLLFCVNLVQVNKYVGKH